MITHPSTTSYKNGCRCDECKEVVRISKRAWLDRTLYGPRGRGPRPHRAKAEHGTLTMYRKYGCKCDPCKIANTEYTRAYRAKPDRWIENHGKPGGYSAGCRCAMCTEAWRVYQREYMRARRAKQAVTAGGENGNG